MWNDGLVIDAVGHAYDYTPENRRESCPPELWNGLLAYVHQDLHLTSESRREGFPLTLEEYARKWSAAELASVYFEESDVDIVAYHTVGLLALSNRGFSPFDVGAEMKRAYPKRTLLYAGVDPLAGPSELEAMERSAAEVQIDGWKLYPASGAMDAIRHKPYTYSLSDPEVAFPYYEKALELGVTKIAIHKGVPIGPGPREPNHPDDVGIAATAFPDLTFEVVHSGWAFLEDCAMQMITHPNIYANLECVANFIVRRPRHFAHVLGTLMYAGGTDRLLWGTGGTVSHPQPILRAFAEFQMPDDLVEGYGFSPLDDEIKAKILGGNMARLHGIDAEARLSELVADTEFELAPRDENELPEHPWRMHREAAVVAL
jgi:predicted TIM-barrel fold metal-dependent hydrolase